MKALRKEFLKNNQDLSCMTTYELSATLFCRRILTYLTIRKLLIFINNNNNGLASDDFYFPEEETFDMPTGRTSTSIGWLNWQGSFS